MSNNNREDQRVNEQMPQETEENGQASDARDALAEKLNTPAPQVTTNPGIKNS